MGVWQDLSGVFCNCGNIFHVHHHFGSALEGDSFQFILPVVNDDPVGMSEYVSPPPEASNQISASKMTILLCFFPTSLTTRFLLLCPSWLSHTSV